MTSRSRSPRPEPGTSWAVIGGIFGAAVHPAPQYIGPDLAFGAIATAVMLANDALGIRMGAIPTA